VRPEIERRLLSERRQSAVDAWLAERETNADIELFDETASGAGSDRRRDEAAVSFGARRR
jgi:hypothetical protein